MLRVLPEALFVFALVSAAAVAFIAAPSQRPDTAVFSHLRNSAAASFAMSDPAPASTDPTLGSIDDDLAVQVSFSRQVRPILADNCFACHGPDEQARKASLRLDTPDGALVPARSGSPPIVPGIPDSSELLRRITCDDPGDRMPPPATNKTITPEQADIVRRWIAQGARYETHWSFVPPAAHDAPSVADPFWCRGEIDSFILARLESEGLAPSAQADRATLCRRLHLDLTGLPPTVERVRAFVADDAPDAYERLVDELLNSPHFGERLAMDWLDAARYADTNGYHIDNERFLWRWRDWVIDAFNSNMPYDRFTIEQLAGDMLPDPTIAQRIATGFNRNHMINFEGGAIAEEYLNEYIVDRVSTASTVWLGLTMGCARCHDHKYDPISMRDFYSLYAVFNNVPEIGLDGFKGNSVPMLRVPTSEQSAQLATIDAALSELQARLDGPLPEADAAQPEWEARVADAARTRWTVLEPFSLVSLNRATLTRLPDSSVRAESTNPASDVYEFVAYTSLPRVTALRLEALRDPSLPANGPGRFHLNGNFVLSSIRLEAAPAGSPAPGPVPLAAAAAEYNQPNFEPSKAIDADPLTGWAVDGKNPDDDIAAVFVPAQPILADPASPGMLVRVTLSFESPHVQHALGRFRLSVTGDEALHESLAPPPMSPWRSIGPFRTTSGGAAFDTAFPPEREIALTTTYDSLAWTLRPDLVDSQVHPFAGENAATYLYRTIDLPRPSKITFSLGSDDAFKLWVNSNLVLERNVARAVAPDQDSVTVELPAGRSTVLFKVVNFGGLYAFTFRATGDRDAFVPLDLERLAAIPPETRSPAQQARLRERYRATSSPQWREMAAQRDARAAERAALDAQVGTTMVMEELPMPRETRMRIRGAYDQLGDVVSPALPVTLASVAPPPDGPVNRLAFARWLVSPGNPLTARVTVNRYWQFIFGTGLVETSEDFGIQGSPPSHPELLDTLAVRFVESGWDVKALLRAIVTSATYRQSSASSPLLLERDPANRLLARGPRHRLEAESLRDNALAISGLLVPTIGGRSVKPYDNPRLWSDVAIARDEREYSAQVYSQSSGADLYRRGMYTFRKRSAPPGMLSLFNTPNREVCTVRRTKSNTPLQALALLNDPTFVEAARAFAQRIMKSAPSDPALADLSAHDAMIRWGFTAATAHPPDPDQARELHALYSRALDDFWHNPGRAEQLLSVGESPRDESLDPVRHAAWTIVASAMLNADRTISKD